MYVLDDVDLYTYVRTYACECVPVDLCLWMCTYVCTYVFGLVAVCTLVDV